MYKAIYRTKGNGLPILSKMDIDKIANNLVSEYQPEIIQSPSVFDIEGFSEIYMDVDIDYQYLSHDGRYLGMMVFNSTNSLPIYNPRTNKAEYLSVKEDTAIIETSLLEPGNENIYRFTLAHEVAGHAYLHKDYHYTDPNQMSLFEMENKPIIECRKNRIFTYGIMPPKQLKTDVEWMEWQANYMASAILMPMASVDKLIDDLAMKFDSYSKTTKNIEYISQIFKVSKIAVEIRLKNLGLIKELSSETVKQIKFDEL